MLAFWIIAAILILVALAFVLPKLLRSIKNPGKPTHQDANLALYRDQFSEIEDDHKSGILDEIQYQESRKELERRLLEDIPASQNTAVDPPLNKSLAIVIGIIVPILGLALYWHLGKPNAMVPDTASHNVASQDINEMIANLANRLKTQPEDAKGWMLLGRSYVVVERYPEASEAYAKAHALLGNQPDLLADYAEALALANGGRFDKKASALLATALRDQPDHLKSLSLSGMAAFQTKDFGEATKFWEKLSQLIPPQSEDGRILHAYLEKARSQSSETPSEKPEITGSPEKGVRVRVELDRQLISKVVPSDTVFVFARAVQGPKMPLAIVRKQAAELPFELTLDDSMAMSETLKLSSFDQIKIGARISKSGMAMPQSGDLVADDREIDQKSKLRLTLIKIERVLP